MTNRPVMMLASKVESHCTVLCSENWANRIIQTSDMPMTQSYWQRMSTSFEQQKTVKLDQSATCDKYECQEKEIMILEKTQGNMQCWVNVKGQRLTQVKENK